MKQISYILILALFSVGNIYAQNSFGSTNPNKGDSLVQYMNRLAITSAPAALEKSKKLQTQALRANDSILFAKALLVDASAHFHLSQITQSISKSNEALSIFESYQFLEGLIMSYYQLGILEGYSGNYYQSLLKLQKSLNLSKQIADKSWKPKILYQIAEINFRQKEFELSWERADASQNLIAKGENRDLLSKVYSLKALLLIEGNDLSRASDMLTKSKSTATASDSSVFERLYASYGALEAKRNNWAESENYFKKAIRIAEGTGNPWFYTMDQLDLSNVYLNQGLNDEALEVATVASNKASELENMALLQRDAALLLSNVYLNKEDSAKALAYMTRAKDLEDNVLIDNVNKFVLLQNQGVAGKEVNNISNDDEASNDEGVTVIKNETANLMIIGGLLLLCALLIVVIIRRKSPEEQIKDEELEEEGKVDEVAVVQKAASPRITNRVPEEVPPPKPDLEKELEEQQYVDKLKQLEQQLVQEQEKAAEKQSELDAQNKHFEEMDKTKNKVFSVLTHDLRQPINQIKSVLNLLEMEQLDGDDRREIVEKLKESVDNSSNALENLLLWSKKQLTGISTQIVDVHLLPQVWQLESHLKPNFEAKKLKLVLNIPDFFKVKADMNQLDICLRNLLTNAIKFSKPGGKITVDAIEENGQKIVRVIDQGVGMTANQLTKLRNETGSDTTLGTLNEKGTGLGIMITKEFMENQKGKLDIVSRKGEGSIFSLIFSSGTASRSPYQSELEKL